MCKNGLTRRQSIIDKVRANTEIVSGGCHIWQGPCSGEGRGGGYPRMSLNGQTVAVHRVVYTHYNGFIPGKKQIDHVCRNRRCVNPDHLEMVTHRENQRRRDSVRVDPLVRPNGEPVTDTRGQVSIITRRRDSAKE